MKRDVSNNNVVKIGFLVPSMLDHFQSLQAVNVLDSGADLLLPDAD